VAVGAGTVFVADFLDSTIRQVDGAGIITTTAHWRWPCTDPADEGQLGVSPAALATSGGSLYAGGWICHGGTLVEGILRADADGSRHFIAALPHVSALAVTAGGGLLAGNDLRGISQGASVFSVNTTTGALQLLAGDALVKTPGDYLRATAAGIPVVHGMATVNGHLYLADGSLRLIW
jgi:hypothetical protein